MEPNLKRKAPETPLEEYYDHRPYCPSCQDRGCECAYGCIFGAAYPQDLLEQFPLLKKFHGLDQVEKLLLEIPDNDHQRQSFLRNLIIDAAARDAYPVIGFVDTITTLSREMRLLQSEWEDFFRRHQSQSRQQQQIQTTPSNTLMRSDGPRLQYTVNTLELIQEQLSGKQI